ncbi:MAG: hypothetical protein MUE44_35180 [Oscillatoriaceae cyanobacterium Prado104]|nr:hypothetical protein [Oscillatoriaceae cyanobacterium Prado104]
MTIRGTICFGSVKHPIQRHKTARLIVAGCHFTNFLPDIGCVLKTTPVGDSKRIFYRSSAGRGDRDRLIPRISIFAERSRVLAHAIGSQVRKD